MALVAGVGTALADFSTSGNLNNTGTGGEVVGSNNVTGPYSLNKNIWKINRHLDIKVKNENKERNYLDYLFNTGKNETEKNTEVGDVSTGSIRGSLTVVNDSNGGFGGSSVNGVDGNVSDVLSVDPNFSNSITGPYSENINKATIENHKKIDIKNKADIKNDIDIKANTGKNEVEKNTIVGDVSTGDITVTGRVENVANENQCFTCEDLLGLVKNHEGLGIASDFSNNTTGPDSVNKNLLKLDDKLDVKVENKANIKNDIDVKANTGKNEVEKNTVVGNVSTGDVNVDFSVLNKAN